jgi:hypothetical protein
MHPQRVHHNVTRVRGVAISGKLIMYAVAITLKMNVLRSALVLWWLIHTSSVVSILATSPTSLFPYLYNTDMHAPIYTHNSVSSYNPC